MDSFCGAVVLCGSWGIFQKKIGLGVEEAVGELRELIMDWFQGTVHIRSQQIRSQAACLNAIQCVRNHQPVKLLTCKSCGRDKCDFIYGNFMEPWTCNGGRSIICCVEPLWLCYIFLLKDHQLNNSLLTGMILQFFSCDNIWGKLHLVSDVVFSNGLGGGCKATASSTLSTTSLSTTTAVLAVLSVWSWNIDLARLQYEGFLFSSKEEGLALSFYSRGSWGAFHGFLSNACHEARWPFTFPSRQFFGVATCLFLIHEKKQLVSRFASQVL